MEKQLTCPLCKGSFPVFANPAPTTDVIIHGPDGRVVLIARRNEPLGWALPGGFVDEIHTHDCPRYHRHNLQCETEIPLKARCIADHHSRVCSAEADEITRSLLLR